MISLFLLGVTGCSVEESSQEPHAEDISQEKDNQTDDVIEEAEEKARGGNRAVPSRNTKTLSRRTGKAPLRSEPAQTQRILCDGIDA